MRFIDKKDTCRHKTYLYEGVYLELSVPKYIIEILLILTSTIKGGHLPLITKRLSLPLILVMDDISIIICFTISCYVMSNFK